MKQEELINRIKKDGIKRYRNSIGLYYYELYADDFPELFSEIENRKYHKPITKRKEE